MYIVIDNIIVNTSKLVFISLRLKQNYFQSLRLITKMAATLQYNNKPLHINRYSWAHASSTTIIIHSLCDISWYYLVKSRYCTCSNSFFENWGDSIIHFDCITSIYDVVFMLLTCCVLIEVHLLISTIPLAKKYDFISSYSYHYPWQYVSVHIIIAVYSIT